MDKNKKKIDTKELSIQSRFGLVTVKGKDRAPELSVVYGSVEDIARLMILHNITSIELEK